MHTLCNAFDEGEDKTIMVKKKTICEIKSDISINIFVFEVTVFISYDKQFDNWDTKQKTNHVSEGRNKQSEENNFHQV